MYFVCYGLSIGWRTKCMTVTEDFKHECVSLSVDWGISGKYVTRRWIRP